MTSLKQLFGGGARQFGMVFALIALVLIFQFATGGKVLTPTNAQNIINGNSYVLILAIGMVLVIIAGHIDLSVGSVAAVVGIIVALAIRDWGIPWWLGIVLGLAVGAVIGAWQGFWVAYVGIPGFITTLAGMMFFRGANQYIGKSNTVPVPKEIQFLGAGYLPEWGPNTGLNNSTLLLGILAIAALVYGETRRRRSARRLGGAPIPTWASVVRVVLLAAVIAGATWLFGSGRYGTSFPISGVILVVLVLVYAFISNRTITGRHVYAVGGNRIAASLSGVNIRRTNFFVMMNMSILAALAGIIFIGRSTASGPFDGTNWELDAIAAVFIGGAAVSGGVGTVVGSLIGGLVMAVLNNGLQLMGVGSDSTQMIKGLVLLAAVAFDVYNKIQGRPSIVGLLLKGVRRGPVNPEGDDSGQGTGANPVSPAETLARN
ncbi:multiple monosaccharide ABC transporter permease [Cellulomonas taurus]|jgi:putative multiple sugar transport system permease protein|uniref:multiple monosaccharide ABC transporter permease n=1 Tax=Cellulomonas taurus TaxID=2729175 RepID=UPI00145C9C8B|nr:multiple monosaccharide ABC transporter permease [Cellulomonas taurus]